MDYYRQYFKLIMTVTEFQH